MVTRAVRSVGHTRNAGVTVGPDTGLSGPPGKHRGPNATEEKGAAAFFKRVGTSSNGIFFAFHSMAKRGTILKVHNPGTGKTVYAKVIGTVPTTATYHNALIGLSSDARENLGVFEDKAWVQVSYATP